LLLNIKETNFDAAGIDINTKIDLVCVIDISGSMAGQKIECVKKTMIKLLEVLEGHRLAIILFDTVAELYMNFKIVNKKNYENIKLGIELIASRRSTNITAGIIMAQHLIGLRTTKNHVSSIFLLSDGSHNFGEINCSILFDGDTTKTKCEYTVTSFGYGDDHDAKLL
jgi:Mg-chelatase subunit ChlD